MGPKGGIPMGEDRVAAEPRQIWSRLRPGMHFDFAFMHWSVRRGKPYERARLVGVRSAAFSAPPLWDPKVNTSSGAAPRLKSIGYCRAEAAQNPAAPTVRVAAFSIRS